MVPVLDRDVTASGAVVVRMIFVRSVFSFHTSYPTRTISSLRNRQPVDPEAVEKALSSLASSETYGGMAGLFGALADTTRASIVHTLLQRELCTLDLAIVLGLSPPTVSQHLRVLRDLRLVRSRRHGRLVLYHLNDAHVAQLVSIGLAHESEGRRD